MQVVRYDQLIPKVLVKLPAGYPTILINDALRIAAGVFCADTEIWKERLAAQNLVANQKAYTIDPGYSAGIRRVYQTDIRSAAEVTAGSDGSLVNMDTAVFSPRTNIITFKEAISATSVTGGLVFTVILIPEFNSNEIAEWIVDRWSDAIIAGAVADICGRPGATWSPAVKEQANIDLRNAEADAMRETMAEFKSGSVQFQPGWRLI
jgi:hypothetical protein